VHETYQRHEDFFRVVRRLNPSEGNNVRTWETKQSVRFRHAVVRGNLFLADLHDRRQTSKSVA
jgi:hypothetical protein